MNEGDKETYHTPEEKKAEELDITTANISTNDAQKTVNIDPNDTNDLAIGIDNHSDGNETELDELLENEIKDKYDGRACQLPDFAVLWSFLDMFGSILELPDITINDLEHSIELNPERKANDGHDNVLEMLHTKLFRKLHKSPKYSYLSHVKGDRLYKIIMKFCNQMNFQCTWDIQQYGYHILTSAQKLKILKALCELQFDENPKFRASLQELYKSDPARALRLTPFGFEQEGLNVWYHEDKHYNIRVYAGEEDDDDGSTWKVRAGSVNDLEEYISSLKKQCEVNPKDVAAEKIKQRKAHKQAEREKRREEREQKRKEEEKQQNNSRKSKRGKKKVEIVESEGSSSTDEDDGCARCHANNQSDLVLLCDGCDAAYHTLCLRPPIMDIPEGDWFCPFCRQLELVDKLSEKCNQVKANLRAKERASKRLNFYGITTQNIIKEVAEGTGRRTAREKKVDYSFSKYDEMMKDAMKDAYYNTNSSRIEPSDSGQQSKRESRKRQKRYTLPSYDDYSDNSSDDSDYVQSESGEDTDNFIVGDDYDEIEERHRNKYLRRSKRNASKTNSRGYRKKYRNNHESETSDETIDNFGQRRSRRIRKKTTIAYYDDNSTDEEKSEKEDKYDDEWKKSSDEESDGGSDSTEDDILDSDCYLDKDVIRKSPRKKRKMIESDDEEIVDGSDSNLNENDQGEEEELPVLTTENTEKNSEKKTTDERNNVKIDSNLETITTKSSEQSSCTPPQPEISKMTIGITKPIETNVVNVNKKNQVFLSETTIHKNSTVLTQVATSSQNSSRSVHVHKITHQQSPPITQPMRPTPTYPYMSYPMQQHQYLDPCLPKTTEERNNDKLNSNLETITTKSSEQSSCTTPQPEISKMTIGITKPIETNAVNVNKKDQVFLSENTSHKNAIVLTQDATSSQNSSRSVHVHKIMHQQSPPITQPMRPTPTYSYMSYPMQQHHYLDPRLPNSSILQSPNQSFQTSFSTPQFYHQSAPSPWNIHGVSQNVVGQYPFNQMQFNQNNIRSEHAVNIPSQNNKKKQMKANDKETKKHRDQRRQNSPSISNVATNSINNMNYFRNMVISGDQNNQNSTYQNHF